MANSPTLDYRQILAALRSKGDEIQQAILIIERLSSSEGSVSKQTSYPKSSSTESAPVNSGQPKKRFMSEAGRKRIAAAAQKRWRLKKAADAAASTKKAGRKATAKKPD